MCKWVTGTVLPLQRERERPRSALLHRQHAPRADLLRHGREAATVREAPGQVGRQGRVRTMTGALRRPRAVSAGDEEGRRALAPIGRPRHWAGDAPRCCGPGARPLSYRWFGDNRRLQREPRAPPFPPADVHDPRRPARRLQSHPSKFGKSGIRCSTFGRPARSTGTAAQLPSRPDTSSADSRKIWRGVV